MEEREKINGLCGVHITKPPRGELWVILISYKTIIVMAECAINGVRHRPKELEVTPIEIRWKYIRGLVSR